MDFLSSILRSIISGIIIAATILIVPETHKIVLNYQAANNIHLIYNYIDQVQIDPLQAMLDPNYKPTVVKAKYMGTVWQGRIFVPIREKDGRLVRIEDRQFLMTNYHICKDNKTMFIEDGMKTHEVEVLVVDARIDLCILKPYERHITAYGLFLEPYQYETLYTAGYPHGEALRLYKGDYIGDRFIEHKYWSETSIKTNPGQSGSPVFNVLGGVVGVISMTDTRLFEGIYVQTDILWSFINENLDKLK